MGLPRWPSGKESTCPMQETQDTHHRSLGREDPLEEEITTYSSLFPWTEKPVGLGHILTCLHQTFSHISIINDPRLNQLLLSLFQYNVFLISIPSISVSWLSWKPFSESEKHLKKKKD